MRRRLASLLLPIGLLAAGPALAGPAFEDLNRALTDRVAIPAYERMAKAMTGLETATTAFCRDPDDAGLTAAKEAFHVAMGAWQAAQPIAFGPVTREGRDSRIQFWPDKGGTAARQVRRALQAQDPALVAEGGLAGKSVALQNLSTYERILFGRGEDIAAAGADAEARYACALAAAIARFQAGLAAEILADWTGPAGYRETVLTAAAGNAVYVAAEEPATAFLKSLSGSLDRAVLLKLERPLGSSIDKARPKRAESWRSERSLRNIVANLETAQALYAVPGGFGDLLAATGAEALDAGLRRDLDAAIAMARAIELPLREAVADEGARPQVEALRERLKALRLLVDGVLAGEIGLVVGFNALDGD